MYGYGAYHLFRTILCIAAALTCDHFRGFTPLLIEFLCHLGSMNSIIQVLSTQQPRSNSARLFRRLSALATAAVGFLAQLAK